MKCKSRRFHLRGGFLGFGLSLIGIAAGLAISAGGPIAAVATIAPPAAQAASATSALTAAAVALLPTLGPLRLNCLRPQSPGPRLHLRLSDSQLGLDVGDPVVVQRIVVMSPNKPTS